MRRKRKKLQFLTDKSYPRKEFPTWEAKSCTGRGDPAGEA